MGLTSVEQGGWEALSERQVQFAIATSCSRLKDNPPNKLHFVCTFWVVEVWASELAMLSLGV